MSSGSTWLTITPHMPQSPRASAHEVRAPSPIFEETNFTLDTRDDLTVPQLWIRRFSDTLRDESGDATHLTHVIIVPTSPVQLMGSGMIYTQGLLTCLRHWTQQDAEQWQDKNGPAYLPEHGWAYDLSLGRFEKVQGGVGPDLEGTRRDGPYLVNLQARTRADAN